MAEYNGVWVFAEQRNGELQKVSLEILGEGRRLADELGVNLTAVLFPSFINDAMCGATNINVNANIITTESNSTKVNPLFLFIYTHSYL